MAKPVFRLLRLDQLVLPRRGIRTGRRKHDELVGSIDELGVLVPLVVRKVGKKYEVVAGAGRLEALKQLDGAGTTRVPCVVVDVDDAEATLLALVENIVREDMVPFDKAKTARVLVKEDGFTQERVARALGMTPPTVSGWLAVFELDRRVVAALERGIIQMRSALALLPLRDDKKAQREILARMQKEELNAAQMAALVTARLHPGGMKPVRYVVKGAGHVDAKTTRSGKLRVVLEADDREGLGKLWRSMKSRLL